MMTGKKVDYQKVYQKNSTNNERKFNFHTVLFSFYKNTTKNLDSVIYLMQNIQDYLVNISYKLFINYAL